MTGSNTLTLWYFGQLKEKIERETHQTKNYKDTLLALLEEKISLETLDSLHPRFLDLYNWIKSDKDNIDWFMENKWIIELLDNWIKIDWKIWDLEDYKLEKKNYESITEFNNNYYFSKDKIPDLENKKIMSFSDLKKLEKILPWNYYNFYDFVIKVLRIQLGWFRNLKWEVKNIWQEWSYWWLNHKTNKIINININKTWLTVNEWIEANFWFPIRYITKNTEDKFTKIEHKKAKKIK